jgi:hypothetical protein
MAAPPGRLEGTSSGNRDRAFGRLGSRASSPWVYSGKRDVTVSILETRARLNLPRGADLPLILPERSMVLRSSAGSWPKRLPPTASERLEELEWQQVREAHLRLNGPPGSPLPAPALVEHEPRTFHDGTDLRTEAEADTTEPSPNDALPPIATPISPKHTAASMASSPDSEHEQMRLRRDLIAAVSQPKQLTYSIRPPVGAPFDHSAVRWEDRHHIGTRNEVSYRTRSLSIAS